MELNLNSRKNSSRGGKKIISQKKVISPEDYKKVSELRTKVSKLQRQKQIIRKRYGFKDQKQGMNF